MAARPWILAETDWREVQENGCEVAVLPWGATEAHNYHLPYATDTYQCDFIAHESCRRAWEAGSRVRALPCVPFGVNTGQINLPLHLNMNPSTQFLVLRDIVDALSRQKIDKLVLLNGHGGNDFKQMIRELTPQFSTFICTLNWYQMAEQAKYFEDLGDHAGELETSAMLHIAPELVRPLDEAGSGREYRFVIPALRARKVWAPRDWQSATRDTGIGDPSRATAEKGHAFLEEVTTSIAEFLIQLAAADLEDLYDKPV
ncbi:MAG: creatinine amidohydrolase [Abditibacteriota bacterium]|nr:creatinine amidohydrolase [Abditibacteriota bacterium]